MKEHFLLQKKFLLSFFFFFFATLKCFRFASETFLKSDKDNPSNYTATKLEDLMYYVKKQSKPSRTLCGNIIAPFLKSWINSDSSLTRSTNHLKRIYLTIWGGLKYFYLSFMPQSREIQGHWYVLFGKDYKDISKGLFGSPVNHSKGYFWQPRRNRTIKIVFLFTQVIRLTKYIIKVSSNFTTLLIFLQQNTESASPF